MTYKTYGYIVIINIKRKVTYICNAILEDQDKFIQIVLIFTKKNICEGFNL